MKKLTSILAAILSLIIAQTLMDKVEPSIISILGTDEEGYQYGRAVPQIITFAVAFAFLLEEEWKKMWATTLFGIGVPISLIIPLAAVVLFPVKEVSNWLKDRISKKDDT